MKQFYISGCIIDNDAQRECIEDLTPSQFNAYLKKLNDGDEVELIINSPGGSVTSGIAIAAAIQRAIQNGRHITARIEGLAASITSVIACACEKISMTESSFLMIHNAWTIIQGNSNDLRKEAEIMDKMNEAIMSFYKSKFNCSPEKIKEMMDNETWIVGKDAHEYGFNCEIIPDVREYNIAAKCTKFKFNKVPNMDKEIKAEVSEEVKEEIKEAIEEVKEEIAEVKEEVKEVKEEIKETSEAKAEETEEETKEEEKPEETEEKKEEASVEMVAKAEADKRVSGMQASMQKQINALKSDYEAKIMDFTNQLKQKDDELNSVKAELTSITQKFDKTASELAAMSSALEEKKLALSKLNGGVNTPELKNKLPTMAEGLKACKSDAEKVAFLKSGNYTK